MAVDPALAKSLFLAASELPDSAERADYLHRECAGNEELRARVEALLRVNDAMPLPPDEATAVRLGKVSAPCTKTEDYCDLNAVAGALIAGKYKLLQQIGEGGMGTVWMADQTEPVKRRVAVKLIRTERGQSKTILSRFEAERQAIALMDHPHIAKLLDAGTNETGAPFFVMELVKGVPLTEYCDAHKLSIPDRLNLFMKICSAVQHAHQKGIIHRDLKPSNILVESHDGKPVPKVIDFGLAKATSGLQLTENTLFTGFGTVMGTPLYMAPEQANFNAIDIDTRVDVYALGVILYELLTGTTPLTRETIKKVAMDEMLRLVREMEAPAPSSRLSSSDGKPTIAANRQMEPARLGNFVKGELDWIVLKALSKERDRRYETANGFARDIERFLTHEPVQAGPPSTSYRLRKFVQRNRLQVIAASVVLMTLVAGIVGTSLALFEAQRQKEIALAEVDKKDKARKNTREALDTLTSDALSDWFTREQSLSQVQIDVLHRLLGHYAQFAEEGGDAVDDRKGQVKALLRMGRMQRALGDLKSAGSSLRRAVELAGTAATPITDDADGLELVNLSNEEVMRLNKAEHDHKEEEIHSRESLAAAIRMKSKIEPPHRVARINIAAARVNLAASLTDQDRFDEADEENRTAAAELELLIAEFPKDPLVRVRLAVLLHNGANALNLRGKSQDGLVLNSRSLELIRGALEEEPKSLNLQLELVQGLRNQSWLLNNSLRLSEAVTVRREAIGIDFALCRKFPSVLKYRTDLGKDLMALSRHLGALGSTEEAAEEASKGVAVIRQVVADFPDVQSVRDDFIEALCDSSQLAITLNSFQKAETTAREALAECKQLSNMGFDQYRLGVLRVRAMKRVARALQVQGQHSGSVAVLKDAINELVLLGDEHADNVLFAEQRCNVHIDIARSMIFQLDPDAAIKELQAALPILDRLSPANRERLHLVVVFELSRAFGLSGCWTESEEYAAQAVDGAKSLILKNPDFYEHKLLLTQSHWHRATARDQLGRYFDAATDWKSAADLADIPMDKAFYLAHCGTSLAKSGNAERATIEIAAALLEAKTALKAIDLPGQAFYDAAVVYSLASGAVTDPGTAETQAVEAVRLLSRAAEVGFLKDPAQVQALLADDAFIPMHERPDYKELLSRLNQKIPPD